jgi:class 3 adenylate cyclase
MGLLKSKKVNRPEITQRLSQYGVSQEIIIHLLNFLEQAEDVQLHRINPRVLATRLQLEERQVLDLLAIGMREGLFNLNWEVQCPVCTFQGNYFPSLGRSRSQIKCVGCNHDFEAHFDEHVQVTFSIHPNVRSLSKNVTNPSDVMVGFLKKKEIDGEFKPVTAHELLTVQVFRDFFKGETLPEGESFEVRRVAILFTDLAGSTALYTRKGDPTAYDLVREHFTILRQVIDASRGAIIKTIGDAVMGAFTSEAQALQAALEAQRAIEYFNRNRNLPDDDRLMLKIGLHAGPSLYVNLNDRLDYFGSTVNTAARAEGQSRAGEIVFTDAILNAPGVKELLSGYELESNEVQLKGLDGKTRLWRLNFLSSPAALVKPVSGV